MTYALSDIFIGNFPVTQDFGANPQAYNARYGIKGHNGTDFGCPTNTMILSAADGKVMEVGFDAGGYGKYIKIIHDGFLTLYGHLNDYQIQVGDHIVSGQLIGHSNNTGNSTGPHLHFGVAPCDVNGSKTLIDNGYSGYIDPMGSDCVWNIKNLTSPVETHINNQPDIAVSAHDFPIMVAQGTDYKVIANFALGNGLNDFLTANGIAPIDMGNNPGDPEGGNKIVSYISDLLVQIKELKDKNTKLEQSSTIVDAQPQTDQGSTSINEQVNLTDSQKTGLFLGLISTLKNFIFEQK